MFPATHLDFLTSCTGMIYQLARARPAMTVCSLPSLLAGTKLGSRTMSTHPTSRSLLGTSVGFTVAAITASVVAWPVADLLIAPCLIAEAMERPNLPHSPKHADPSAVAALQNLMAGDRPRLCVLSGGTQEMQCALVQEVGQGRRIATISLREATAPHTMETCLLNQLYKPLSVAPLLACLGVCWLSLFDMLISDHEHTRHRDFCVVLAQLRRALHRAVKEPGKERPLIIIEHMHVPASASMDVGGKGLAPMLRSLHQFLCAVSIDEGLADVLILAPYHVDVPEKAKNTWLRQTANPCYDRTKLTDGVMAIGLTQPEAIDKWLNGMQLGSSRARKDRVSE